MVAHRLGNGEGSRNPVSARRGGQLNSLGFLAEYREGDVDRFVATWDTNGERLAHICLCLETKQKERENKKDYLFHTLFSLVNL